MAGLETRVIPRLLLEPGTLYDVPGESPGAEASLVYSEYLHCDCSSPVVRPGLGTPVGWIEERRMSGEDKDSRPSSIGESRGVGGERRGKTKGSVLYGSPSTLSRKCDGDGKLGGVSRDGMNTGLLAKRAC